MHLLYFIKINGIISLKCYFSIEAFKPFRIPLMHPAKASEFAFTAIPVAVMVTVFGHQLAV